MGIIAQARLDINDIVTNANDFGVTLVFEAPTSPVTIKTIIGTGKHISLKFDELGMVQGRGSNATCTVTEAALIAASYPYKDGNGNITFERHKVTMTDATATGVYMVDTWTPDKTLGLIVLEMGDFT